MGRSEREKGKRGERELAGILRDYGYPCRRGQQFSGANGDADVVGLPGIHIECKRCERLNLKAALMQSRRDSKSSEIPVVMHRKDREPWKVSMYIQNFEKIYRVGVCSTFRRKIYGGKITLLLDDWICFYREWQSEKELEQERE